MTAEALREEKPHYTGHRQRLRERFLNNGPDALADYELLELLLFLAIPQRDVKPLAKSLLVAFGSLAGVMNAPAEALMRVEGVKDGTAAAIKTIAALSHRMLRQELQDQPVLTSWDRLIDYCMAAMAHEPREQFRVIFLNKKNRIIADEVQGAGTVDHAPAYTREILRRALELGATALVLVHNHPSGDPKPSRDDIDLTHDVMAAAAPLGISVHDHVIVARSGYTSFKTAGLI